MMRRPRSAMAVILLLFVATGAASGQYLHHAEHIGLAMQVELEPQVDLIIRFAELLQWCNNIFFKLIWQLVKSIAYPFFAQFPEISRRNVFDQRPLRKYLAPNQYIAFKAGFFKAVAGRIAV